MENIYELLRPPARGLRVPVFYLGAECIFFIRDFQSTNFSSAPAKENTVPYSLTDIAGGWMRGSTPDHLPDSVVGRFEFLF